MKCFVAVSFGDSQGRNTALLYSMELQETLVEDSFSKGIFNH
jgi:hypothetical protein